MDKEAEQHSRTHAGLGGRADGAASEEGASPRDAGELGEKSGWGLELCISAAERGDVEALRELCGQYGAEILMEIDEYGLSRAFYAVCLGVIHELCGERALRRVTNRNLSGAHAANLSGAHAANLSGAHAANLSGAHAACQRGGLESLPRIVELCGEDILSASSLDGETPAFSTCRSGREECVQWLYDAGERASFPKRDVHGLSPMDAAQANGHEGVVKLLRDLGLHGDTTDDTASRLRRKLRERKAATKQAQGAVSVDKGVGEGAQGEGAAEEASERMMRELLAEEELAQADGGEEKKAARKKEGKHKKGLGQGAGSGEALVWMRRRKKQEQSHGLIQGLFRSGLAVRRASAGRTRRERA